MSDKRIQQLRLQLHPHASLFLNPQTMFIAAVATVHTKKMEELVSQLVPGCYRLITSGGVISGRITLSTLLHTSSETRHHTEKMEELVS